MTPDDFAAAVGYEGDQLLEVHRIFEEERSAHSKTLAARSADLAQDLDRLGIPQGVVFESVRLLAQERRR